MKSAWIAAIAVAATPPVFAQATIYKQVDESGRVTYSNKPMKGAIVMELEPVNIVPAEQKAASTVAEKAPARAIPATLTVTKPSLASVEPQLQRKRDAERRRILEQELAKEEASLGDARGALSQEQHNPVLMAAVRVAQESADPTPAEAAVMRSNLDKASGRIRGLQATVSEHERNIEALRKELAALK